jgi:hypothetical protein
VTRMFVVISEYSGSIVSRRDLYAPERMIATSGLCSQ